MKKEIEKFKNSTLFEGILSISAVWMHKSWDTTTVV